MLWFCEKLVQIDTSFTTFYLKHQNIDSHNPFFVKINCLDISISKSQFPDKNNLFACLYLGGNPKFSKMLLINRKSTVCCAEFKVIFPQYQIIDRKLFNAAPHPSVEVFSIFVEPLPTTAVFVRKYSDFL